MVSRDCVRKPTNRYSVQYLTDFDGNISLDTTVCVSLLQYSLPICVSDFKVNSLLPAQSLLCGGPLIVYLIWLWIASSDRKHTSMLRNWQLVSILYALTALFNIWSPIVPKSIIFISLMALHMLLHYPCDRCYDAHWAMISNHWSLLCLITRCFWEKFYWIRSKGKSLRWNTKLLLCRKPN